MWWENTYIFGPNFANQPYVRYDVKTSLIQCISNIQYWTVWNEVQTCESARTYSVETKQGLSREYQSNFTSTAKRKSKPLIRPSSRCLWEQSRCDLKIPPFSALILQTKFIRKNDVKTALVRWITHIQYWTVLNEVQTCEYSRRQNNETKQGLSSEYQLNYTSMAIRKS
jgi:hypothetical protein